MGTIVDTSKYSDQDAQVPRYTFSEHEINLQQLPQMSILCLIKYLIHMLPI